MSLPFNLSGEETNADTILINGDVVTFDGADSRQEAVAIKGDLIIAVGKNAEISHLAGLRTRTIDLQGRLVTPGLIDSHIHVASSGPYDRYALKLSYPKIESICGIVEAVKERVSSSAPTEWIKGVGWDEAQLEEKRYVTRWESGPCLVKEPCDTDPHQWPFCRSKQRRTEADRNKSVFSPARGWNDSKG